MHLGEPAAGLEISVDDRVDRGVIVAHVRAQRAAFDVLHDHERVVEGGVDLIDGDDVGVLDLGHGPRLAHEPALGALDARTGL